MRGLILLLIGFLLWNTRVGVSQNLVPNPGFENYTTCPFDYDELHKATPWFKPSSGSPELFHFCSPSGSPVGVPVNYGNAYQYPRGGDGYAGLATFKDNYPNFREYISVELIEPLVTDGCYLFEMYAVKMKTARYATDKLGVHIRKGKYYSMTSTNLPVSPQIISPHGQPLTDTGNWTRIAGYYQATGGEDYIIIGNFGTDYQTTTTVALDTSTAYAYYYIDDVSLTEIEYYIDLGPDTILCPGEVLLLDIDIPAATYIWNDGSTDPIRTISEPGVYAVTVSMGQCKPMTDVIQVAYTTPPELAFPSDTTLCEGFPLLLDATFPHSTYLWQYGSTAPYYVATRNGLYHVEVSNPCGIAADSIWVEFDECHNLLFAPNAFTPNGDGINDVFLTPGSGLLEYELVIYDRWGRKVHETKDPLMGWDGTSNNKPCPGGIYHWIVTYRGGGASFSDRREQKTGFVYLIR